MTKFKRGLRWFLTIFMVVGGVAYFPSVASILFWLFAVLSAPIKPLQRFWEYQVKLRGVAKVLIMVALFIGAVMTAPTNTVPVGPSANVQQQESQNSTEDVQEAPETPPKRKTCPRMSKYQRRIQRTNRSPHSRSRSPGRQPRRPRNSPSPMSRNRSPRRQSPSQPPRPPLPP